MAWWGVSWFVRNVGFVPFGWFLLALTLLFIAAMLSRPYAVVDALLMPIILALTISLMIYLTLATTIIDYMQSPRGNQGG